jgi:hypothetical protein
MAEEKLKRKISKIEVQKSYNTAITKQIEINVSIFDCLNFDVRIEAIPRNRDERVKKASANWVNCGTSKR